MSVRMTHPFRVWHIAEVPGEPFYIPARDVHEATAIAYAIAQYDLFQLEEGIRPDFSNVQGVQVWNGEEWEELDEDQTEPFAEAYAEFFNAVREAKP